MVDDGGARYLIRRGVSPSDAQSPVAVLGESVPVYGMDTKKEGKLLSWCAFKIGLLKATAASGIVEVSRKRSSGPTPMRRCGTPGRF